MGFLYILPTLNPEYLQRLMQERWPELSRYAHKVCEQMRLSEYHEDAVCIAFEKLHGRDIIGEGDRDAVRFMMSAIKTTVIDERRRRDRQRWVVYRRWGRGAGEMGEILPTIVDDKVDVEEATACERRFQCLDDALQHLPSLIPKQYKRLRADLKRGLEAVLDDAEARQPRARLRAVLAGWFHGHFGDKPCRVAGNWRYWQLGYNLATRYLKEKESQHG